jgi:hypothetical protein
MEDYSPVVSEEEEEVTFTPISDEEFVNEKLQISYNLVQDNNKVDHIPISIVKYVKALAKSPKFKKIW